MAGKKESEATKAEKKAEKIAHTKQLMKDTTGQNPAKPVPGSQAWADKEKAEGR
jgi:hypothetical protein